MELPSEALELVYSKVTGTPEIRALRLVSKSSYRLVDKTYPFRATGAQQRKAAALALARQEREARREARRMVLRRRLMRCAPPGGGGLGASLQAAVIETAVNHHMAMVPMEVELAESDEEEAAAEEE